MDWLHNPLADMGSFEYLAAYALLAAAASCTIRIRIALADATRGQPPSPIDVDRDPSEIAYLRGGSKGLLQFTIFDLLRRDLLRVNETRTIEATELAKRTPPDPVRPLDAPALSFYGTPRKPEDVRKSDLAEQAERIGEQRYFPRLRDERLLTGAGVRVAARRWGTGSAIVLFAVALYRFIDAMAKGHHNLAFTILEALAALAVVAACSRTSRLSARGTQFLARLRTALAPVRSSAMAAGAGVMPLLVAVTGTAALAGTNYALVNRIYGQNASGSTSSCASGSACGSGGGSSGSSCGGGGGCGGGCGGG